MFISLLFPLSSALLATVNAYKAKLPFVSDKPIHLNILLNDFLIPSFFLFMHKIKIFNLLVNIGYSC